MNFSRSGEATSQQVKALPALRFRLDGLLQTVYSDCLLLLSRYTKHRAVNHVVHPSCNEKSMFERYHRVGRATEERNVLVEIDLSLFVLVLFANYELWTNICHQRCVTVACKSLAPPFERKVSSSYGRIQRYLILFYVCRRLLRIQFVKVTFCQCSLCDFVWLRE